ncbi:L-dopachrome tautomerase-related protein [uncultured Albimonas sp.]|uniref:L-dopachrome tautomerase-related protein n=1 Tax=uncultured Albimonas sp. TaxID=1331701 RepID=UPI0030EF23D4|tara:strand:- start:7037 stop:8233 length:1197 start_codon:yes stop_codon:yes gene_type:complete
MSVHVPAPFLEAAALGLACSFVVALAATRLFAAAPEPPPAQAPLRAEATSRTLVWNAVVPAAHDVFVSGPRWASGSGPQLSRAVDGSARPFPDAHWNAWAPGLDAADRFVNLNALRLDAEGALWAVDTGAPGFGGDPLPGGAKLVRMDPASGRVLRVIRFGPDAALPGSYIDDVRFQGRRAYLTDAGRPGLIVVDLDRGTARRALEGHPSTVARDDRPIVVDGEILRGPDGRPLKVHADPLELSPDGRWLLYGPLAGPWSRVPLAALDDPALPAEALAAAVEPFADLPPTGGTAMAPDGRLVFSDLAADAIRALGPDGRVETLFADPRLHWVDAMNLDVLGRLWMPAAQIDRAALFHAGGARLHLPVTLWSAPLPPAGATLSRSLPLTDLPLTERSPR